MTAVRLSVIGAGSWVNASHLPVLAELGGVDFVGVCRPGTEELAAVQRRWGFSSASEDYHDVLAVDPDIVIVASPSAFHFEHARAALLAGAHVLVEKPFTISSHDAWELDRISAEVGRSVIVSFGYNFKPVVLGARALLAAHGGIGALGAIESMSVSMSSGTRALLSNSGAYPKAAADSPPDPATWIDPALSGGGYAQAQLSHALGAALYLTGQRATEVYALMSATESGVELNDSLAVRYAGGAIGTVSGTSAHPGYWNERDLLHIRVVGSRAQLDLEFERDRVALHLDGETREAALSPGDGSYDCAGPPRALAEIALGRDVVNHAPAELGARTVEILEAAYASARAGVPIPIAHPEESA
jgi:predicted dehydrogenase